MRTQIHRCEFSAGMPRGALCLGLFFLLLHGTSGLFAQTANLPPSHPVQPRNESHPQSRPANRFADLNDLQTVFAPPPVAEPLPPVILPGHPPTPPEVYAPTFIPRPPPQLPFCRYDTPCPDVRTVPNMLGDFFGTGTELLTIRGPQLLNASPGTAIDPASLGAGSNNNFFLTSPGSSVVGRQKEADNGSPVPRDRVFLNYNFASDTSLQTGGVDVHRFTPGFERTFFDRMFSVQVRLPVAATLNSSSVLTGGTSVKHAELGNMYLALKGVMYSSNSVLVSGGMGTSLPTADSLKYFNASGRELVRVRNQAVHLLPYLAGVWTDGGFFAQGFVQVDVDLNGNPVLIDNGLGLNNTGTWHDSSFIYADLGTGYWLTKNRKGCLITGIAPTVELHYNSSLNPTAVANSPSSGVQFGGNLGRVEMTNLVLGTTFQFASRNTLAVGYGTPLGGGNDEQYNGELRVLFNWYFGGN